MRSFAAALMVLAGAVVLTAQDPVVEFEVASVRPAAQPSGGIPARPAPGQFRLRYTTVQNIIFSAYSGFQQTGLIVGGPDWIRRMRFDVEGRMSPTATRSQVDGMIRHLLDRRFALRTHVERRNLDVFLLTMVKSGELGAGMSRSPQVCIDWLVHRGPLPDACRQPLTHEEVLGGLSMIAVTIPEFIRELGIGAVAGFASVVDRPVVDRTGLAGHFQVKGPSPWATRPLAPGEPSESFFTLIQEQLGLKLTPAREMVDVLVIDSVSMPEPD